MKKSLIRWFGRPYTAFGVGRFNGVNKICNRSEFLKLLELERDRVHRNNHQFSILLFSVNPKKKFEIIELANHISKRVRRVDQVGWYDDCHIGVLLPNTSTNGAISIGKDICSHHDRSNSQLNYETLSYPDTKQIRRG